MACEMSIQVAIVGMLLTLCFPETAGIVSTSQLEHEESWEGPHIDIRE